jgi:catechol 2,3-dioxygenase
MVPLPGKMPMTDMPEPLHDIAHLGAVELLTPKLDRSLWFFRHVLGMEPTHIEADAVWLRGYGDYAAATLKLSAAPAAGVGAIAWRASSPQALRRRVAALEAAGLGAGWSNGDFGRGPSYRFRDPEGHRMELYYEEQRYVPSAETRSTLKNLPSRYPGRGVGARRIDHLALLCNDVGANRRFAQELLGLRLHEQVVYDKGATEIGSWLSPSALHHQLAYVLDVKGGHARLHHFALWVDEQQDVLRAADILSENGIFIEAGPAKHNNSQGFYLYSYEPGGNRIEICSGSFLVLAPDFEPVRWDESERGRGVYWGGALPDSFLRYATPDVAGDAGRPAPVFDPR